MKELINFFNNPPQKMYGAPFWAWNGKLDENTLRRQIQIMHTMGFGGFFMHSRTGLDTPYMQNDWFKAIDVCIDEAEKLGMLAYLYDEDRWPSGAAGGIVTSDDRYKAQKLYCTSENIPPEGSFVARFALTLHDGKIVSMRRMAQNETQISSAEKIYDFYWKYMDSTTWYNNAAYLNTMDKDSVDKFIAVTHQKYAELYGSKFSKSVPAIFTDEPCYIHGAILGCLPWTENLCSEFKKRYSYELTDRIPELFFATENEVSQVRHDFYDLVGTFFAENFIGRIAKWGEKHDLPLCGHLLGEDSLSAQTLYIGSAMRCYEKMQIPGVDVLTEHWNIFNTVKQCVSVARQLGRKYRMTETYGCTGWDFPFFGHKAIGDWQYALGINMRCLHLSWYSLAGEGKRDYPASFLDHSPWFKQYSILENYFARLGNISAESNEIRDLLVIHPLESMWSILAKDTTSNNASQAKRQIQPGRKVLDTFDSPEINKMDDAHTIITNALLAANLDFDFGDEEILSRIASADGKIMRVGEAVYRQILIPELKTIRSSTLKLLTEFKGKVFYLGTPPAFVDALPSDEAKKVFADFTSVSIENFTQQIAADFRRVSITDSNDIQAAPLFYRLADFKDGYSLFIANTSMNFDTDQKKAPKVRDRKIVCNDMTIKLSLPFKGNIAEFNPMDGTAHSIDFKYENGFYIFKTSFDQLESRLFIISKVIETAQIETKPAFNGIGTIPDNGFDYTLSEENILILDHAKWTTETASSNEAQYIILADDELRGMIGEMPRGGLMEQPWHRGRKDIEKSIKLTLEYTFECDVIPQENCILSMENPEKFTIYLNAREVQQDFCGFYLDRDIKNIKLDRNLFTAGTNRLILTAPQYDYFTNLEAVYIRGKFGVNEKSHITALPEKLHYGDWCSQNLANYAGNVTYHTEVNNDSHSLLEFPDWRGTLIGVKIDENDEKFLVSFPFAAEIPAGKHRLAITVYGHRRNALGPFYLNEKWPERTGPYQFKVYENPNRQLVPCGLLQAPVIKTKV